MLPVNVKILSNATKWLARSKRWNNILIFVLRQKIDYVCIKYKYAWWQQIPLFYVSIYWISGNGIMGFFMYAYLGDVGHWLFNLKYSFIFEI